MERAAEERMVQKGDEEKMSVVCVDFKSCVVDVCRQHNLPQVSDVLYGSFSYGATENLMVIFKNGELKDIDLRSYGVKHLCDIDYIKNVIEKQLLE